MNPETFTQKWLPAIEQKLEELLTFNSSPQSNLYQAARYSVLGGGKRLRPLFALTAYESFKGDAEKILQPACAIELLHCYSLIHDDLPCMDDDDFRRGKPSLHKHTDEATAVLAGDFLLTYAFEVIANAHAISGEQKVLMIASLARSAGGAGMVGGQLLDLEAEKQAISSEMLEYVHLQKTAEMFACAFDFAAILSNLENQKREIFRKAGLKTGLAFQILDDVLDITASKAKHGKSVSSDQVNGKSTYVTHFGLEGAKQKASVTLNEAFALLHECVPPDSLIEQYIAWVIK